MGGFQISEEDIFLGVKRGTGVLRREKEIKGK